MTWVQIDIEISKENKRGIEGSCNGVKPLFWEIAIRGVDVHDRMPDVVKVSSDAQRLKRRISTRGKLKQERRQRVVDCSKKAATTGKPISSVNTHVSNCHSVRRNKESFL